MDNDDFIRQRAKRAREEASGQQSSLSIVIGRRPGPKTEAPSASATTMATFSSSSATTNTSAKKGPTSTMTTAAKSSATASSVVGTSMVLDKAYVRPATAPNMKQVRPLHILHQAFQQALLAASSPAPPKPTVTPKKGSSSTSSSAPLLAIAPTSQLEVLADKLKSIRQDLTIQALETDFTALVYETHARLCIILNHTTDFGQCLNFVKQLHAKGMSGCSQYHLFDDPQCTGLPKAVRPPVGCSPQLEFAAFRIVYSGLTTQVSTASTGGGGASGGADESAVANEVSWVDRFCPHHNVASDDDNDDDDNGATSSWIHPTMIFALQSVECKANAVPFMLLVRSAPSLCLRQLLMLFVPRLRLEWLKCVAESFADFLPATVLMTFLGYRSPEEVKSSLGPLLGAKYSNGFRGRECKAVLVQHIELLTKGKQ